MNLGKLLWLFILGSGIVYELFCYFKHSVRFPTLTQFVVSTVPDWVTLGFIVWLFWHFLNAYIFRKNY